MLYSNRIIDVAVEPFPSYLDEQAMGVRESSPGIPYVPVQYTFVTTQKVAVTGGSSVWKTSSRLSWGTSAPTGVDLEGANTANTPFVQYRLSYNPDRDAPITRAVYTVATSCAGCPSLPNADGNLISAGRTSGGVLFFDLPLASDNVTPLTQLVYSTPANLTLTLNFTDAAGNTGSRTDALTLHVLGPPLSIAEDTSYSEGTDPRSAYTHRISNGSYASLWSSATFGNENVVRVVRYVLRSPYSTPVQVLVENPGTFSMTHRWNAEVWPWTQVYWRGSLQVKPSFLWNIGPGSTCLPDAAPNFPCGTGGQHLTQFPFLWAPDFLSIQCALLPPPGPVTGVDQPYSTGSSNLASSAWRLEDPSQAAAREGPRYIVPPASGTNPGGIVVYTGRQFASGYSPSLNYAVLENPTGLPRYTNWQYDFWVKQGSDFPCCIGGARCQGYVGSRFATVLVAATERLDGSAIFTAFAPSSSPPRAWGEGRALASYRVQKEVAH